MTDIRILNLLASIEKELAELRLLVAPTIGEERPRRCMHSYLDDLRATCTPQHVSITEGTLERFVNWLEQTGQERLDLVGSRQIHEYRVEVLQPGRKVTTVNKHLATIGAFYTWAKNTGRVMSNPVTPSLRLAPTVAAQEQRHAFTEAQIKHIFRPAFFSRTEGLSAKRWLPLIMLYTGARPEEVAQLYVKDIRYMDDVRVFDFTCVDDGQRRKNAAARRVVPIHNDLLLMGLNRLVGGRWDEGTRWQEPLFPELNSGANGRFAEAPSRWFNGTWLRKESDISDPGLVLYSLRHTVATALKVVHQVPEPLIAQLLGHTNGSITTGRYGKEYPVAELDRVVQLLDWRLPRP